MGKRPGIEVSITITKNPERAMAFEAFDRPRLCMSFDDSKAALLGTCVWLHDWHYSRTGTTVTLCGKAYRHVDLGEALFMMLDPGVEPDEKYTVRVFDSKRKCYVVIEFADEVHLYRYEARPDDWPDRRLPRKGQEHAAWLAELEANARKHGHGGGRIDALVSSMAEAVNNDIWWKIKVL